MKSFLLFSLIGIGLQAYASDPILPDSKLTPGDIVTNVPIRTILAHGYTATKGVRNVSVKMSNEVYFRYGVTRVQGHYEVDHLISLELGGANSVSNLWPQSYLTPIWNAHSKDKLENHLAKICRDELSKNGSVAASNLLTQCQHEIASNWTNCYIKHFGMPK